MNSSVILHVVLYGHEPSSLPPNEEWKPRALENRVMGNLFGPRRNEVIEDENTT